jgi:hypothetical protein
MATKWAGWAGAVMSVVFLATAQGAGLQSVSPRSGGHEHHDEGDDSKDGGAACACVSSCTAGQLCLPAANPCHLGVSACPTGSASTCTDLGSSLPNGTTCGTNQVCTQGVCGACTAGGSCVPADLCHVGTASCATGQQTCVPGAALADGTVCGNGLTCIQGLCGSCTAGLPCAPSNPCHTGVTTCAGNVTSCADTGSVANGTNCGTNLVCSQGTCGTCTAGATCGGGDACNLAIISCTTGQPLCVFTPRPNGTPCGAFRYCTNGVCQ